MPKKITVDCYGPIAHNKKYKSPWEDVWLSWTGKPGRTKYYLAPCLCSKTNVETDYQDTLMCKEKYPEDDWSEEIQESLLILKMLKQEEMFIDNKYDNWNK